ncbi:hypothetical protein IKJ53_06980 [bacterium]|nr:hypothetical protein [bacterium]
MQIQAIQNQHFGNKYKLSETTIKMVEKSTGLTYKEMTTLTSDEAKNLMKQRGTLKKPSKIKQWFVNQYKQLGEKLGFLEKQHNIYTDIH